MKTRICPSCGDEHPSTASYCGCGYKWRGGKEEKRTFDSNNGQCAWESDGKRCTNAGTMAEGTLGSDRWYCAGHYGCIDGRVGHQILLEAYRVNPMPDFSLEARRARSIAAAERVVPESLRGWKVKEYRENARLLLASFGSKKPEGRYNWAYKIMDMVERSERVPYLTQQIAKQRLEEIATP